MLVDTSIRSKPTFKKQVKLSCVKKRSNEHKNEVIKVSEIT